MGYPSINKITKDDLAESLVREIELGSIALAGAVKKNVVEYRETLTRVPFIGQEITEYDPNYDKLEVFLNTVRQTEGVHYNIDSSSNEIVCTDEDGWIFDPTIEPRPNLFEFFMTRTTNTEDIKFGIDNLSPEVLQLINTQQILVTTKLLTGNPISVKEDETIKSFSYIGGEIEYYNPQTCALCVYANGIKLAENIDYTIDEKKQEVILTNTWDGPVDFYIDMFIGLVADNSDNTIIEDIDAIGKAVVANAVAIDQHEGFITYINTEITSLKSSVGNGKELVAAAITDKGIPTASTDTFETMSDNIRGIVIGNSTGDATADKVLAGYTFSNAEGIDIVGTIPSIKGHTLVPSTEDFVLEGHKYLASDLVIAGDSELIADNIRYGHTIYTVEGQFTGDADVTADDIPSGMIAYAKGERIEGSKRYLGGYIIPSTEDQIVDNNVIVKDLTVKGDQNLLPENIASNVTIFGVTGNYTDDATANPSNILSGETAYVSGQKITGTIGKYDDITVIPREIDQIITHGKYLAGDITIKGSKDLIPENIREGVELFGVKGTAMSDLYEENFTIMAADAELVFTVIGTIHTIMIATSTGTSTWAIGKYFAPQDSIMEETSATEVSIESMHITLKLSEDRKTIKYTNEYGLQANAKAIVFYM